MEGNATPNEATPERHKEPRAPMTRLRVRPPEPIACLVGILVVSVAAFTLASNFNLPWLAFTVPQPDGESVAMRSDLRDADAVPYEQRLLTWPPAAATGMAAIGVAVVIGSYLPRLGGPQSRFALAWATGFVGFILALTGTRWLGFYIARLVDTGPTLVHLHAAPYVNLGVGTVLVAAAVAVIVRLGARDPDTWTTGKWPAASVAVAALGLLTLPLLPFAFTPVFGDVVFATDALTLATIGHERPDDGLGPPSAIGWARLTLWGCLYASMLSALAIRFRRPSWPPWADRLRHSIHLNAAFAVSGGIFTVWFYRTLPDIFPETRLGYNYVLPLALLCLMVLWIRQLWVLNARSARPPKSVLAAQRG